MRENNVVIELKGISKSFPGVKALDNISLKVLKGTVLALMGENGAGKSTIIKAITGVHRADEGEIYINGEKVSFRSPRDAFDAGISVVHQERNLIPTFNVAENIFLDKITGKTLGKVDMKELVEQSRKYLDMVGLDMSPKSSIQHLPAGKLQMLEIARALSNNAKVILLDEPTASISVKEADELLQIVDKLRSQGYSFIYVSHKLDEVFHIADQICVIRDGRNAGEIIDRANFDREAIIQQMIGRKSRKGSYPVRSCKDKEVVLEAKNITSRKNPNPCSFQLHKGEILGWYGLVGAGRTEVAREVIGLDPVTDGELLVGGKKATVREPKDAITKYGISYISEDRNNEGLFLIHSIKQNISSPVWKQKSKFLGMVDAKDEKKVAEEYVKNVAIKTPSIDQLVVNLSGGNRQKVSISKGLVSNPDILIFDEPTVGIDIKTKEEIHQMIIDMANQGLSIILISSDMDEIVRVADSIVVFGDGVIRSEIPNTKEYADMSYKIMDAIQTSEEAEEAAH